MGSRPIAATCSAIAAWLSYRTNLKNSKEGVRPEIVLEGWEYTPVVENRNIEMGEIRIKSVRNVGKGHALHMTLNAFSWTDVSESKLKYSMTIRRISLLAANQSFQLDETIRLAWANIEPLEMALRQNPWVLDLKRKSL